MAHFAYIDEDLVVRQVIVIDNSDCGGGDYPGSEPVGRAFIAGQHPDGLALAGLWLQTSRSGSFRGTYAGQGFLYDPDLDVFVAPTLGATP